MSTELNTLIEKNIMIKTQRESVTMAFPNMGVILFVCLFA